VFVSNYETSLDVKGRVSVPAPFRRVLETSSHIYLYPALDGSACLEGGGEALMQQNQRLMMRMSPNSVARRVFMNRAFSKAIDLRCHETGRIRIPEKLLAHAQISKQMIFVGAMDRFQIWSPDCYQAHDADMESQLAEMQEALEQTFHAALSDGTLHTGKGEDK